MISNSRATAPRTMGRAAIEPTLAPASPAQKIERHPAHQLGTGFGI
jgi:hypothetical protein